MLAIIMGDLPLTRRTPGLRIYISYHQLKTRNGRTYQDKMSKGAKRRVSTAKYSSSAILATGEPLARFMQADHLAVQDPLAAAK